MRRRAVAAVGRLAGAREEREDGREREGDGRADLRLPEDVRDAVRHAQGVAEPAGAPVERRDEGVGASLHQALRAVDRRLRRAGLVMRQSGVGGKASAARRGVGTGCGVWMEVAREGWVGGGGGCAP